MKFPIKNKDAVIILSDVAVHGKNRIVNLNMLIYTGSSYTIISPTKLKLLGYDLSNLSNEIIRVAGSNITAPRLIVKKIALEDNFGNQISAENIETVAFDLANISVIDGVLGISFINNFDILFAFKQGYIEIS